MTNAAKTSSDKPLTMTNAIKSVNGTRSDDGKFIIRVVRVQEWNEIQIRMVSVDAPKGAEADATCFIDCGHTKESKAEAVQEMFGIVRDLVRVRDLEK